MLQVLKRLASAHKKQLNFALNCLSGSKDIIKLASEEPKFKSCSSKHRKDVLSCLGIQTSALRPWGALRNASWGC